MFPWETETIQQARAVAAAPSGPENAGNVPCSPNVSFADILGGGVPFNFGDGYRVRVFTNDAFP